MQYYTNDLKYETVMARNIQRVNAVASAAIGLGIAVRARGLARGRIGQDPPRHGWRMQDEIVAAIDRPIKYAHLMCLQRRLEHRSSLLPAIQIGSYRHFRHGRPLGFLYQFALYFEVVGSHTLKFRTLNTVHLNFRTLKAQILFEGQTEANVVEERKVRAFHRCHTGTCPHSRTCRARKTSQQISPSSTGTGTAQDDI
jgi:hypothetical protein